MKRKAESEAAKGHGKKQAIESSGVRNHFGEALFDSDTLENHSKAYAKSEPYQHGVVSALINDTLLRSVRQEILDNIHFTPKETDIYKIHQSGDLANLDGLPASALEKLPSLLKLRDALYSHDFRKWISQVSGAGLLSGTKTDMAVNVYVPGCHLLCHDDVIGSRRVSYILYLTDPDRPWRPEWGGALRLYPTDTRKGEDGHGQMYKVPSHESSKSVPPAWNQLSFFAVQPGESFHDVEEVYHATEKEDRESDEDASRVRMAISGWYHIPQEGEEGFDPDLEAKLDEKSSLQQLQGKAEQFDEPQLSWIKPAANGSREVADELTEADLEFLLHYMTPNYLTPDTVDELNELFADESTLQLTNFLSEKYAARLKDYLLEQSEDLDQGSPRKYRIAGPPYKHRYAYMQPAVGLATDVEAGGDPYLEVLDSLLPSLAFRKWLSLATGLSLMRCAVLARRFRKGLDYQLAQNYEGEDPQLEFTLCITPTPGWANDGEDQVEHENGTNGGTPNGPTEGNAESRSKDSVGGYELYMAGDEADGDDDGSDDGVPVPQSHTGAGDRRSAKSRKADPAVYRAADYDEDDGILFSNAASWNTMSIVLRDEGTLKFVKYVSRAAKGDRYDFTGYFEVEHNDEEEE